MARTDIGAALIRGVARVRAHPIWATMAGLGLFGALDLVGHLQTGSGLMGALFGPDWFAITMASPWFKLACIGLTGLALWRIGALSIREELAAAASKGKAIEGLVAAVKKETALPDVLATVQVLGADIEREASALARATEHIATFRQTVNAIQAGKCGAQQAEREASRFREGVESLKIAASLGGANEHLPACDFPRPNPPAVNPGYLGSTMPFDLEINARLFGLYGDALVDAEKAAREISQAMQERTQHRLELLRKAADMAKARF